MSGLKGMFAAFLKTFEVYGIFGEWIQYLRAETSAETFASLVMEGMRSEDEKLRSQFTAFSTFMASRTWDQMAEAMSPSIPEEDRELLKTPFAKTFYETLQTIVTLQIRSYYRSFVEENKDLPPVEAANVISKDEIALTIQECMDKAVEEAIKRIREELGEDWKGGGSPTGE